MLRSVWLLACKCSHESLGIYIFKVCGPNGVRDYYRYVGIFKRPKFNNFCEVGISLG